MRHAVAVKVRFAFGFFREIAAAFNHHRACHCRNRLALCHRCRGCTFRTTAAAHFSALLFQNRFARQPDAVAFNRQHLHQHLIAFLQLVADVANAMLRYFADVQQPVGARNDFDESSEIRQPRHLA
jgi:hypothetical protein